MASYDLCHREPSALPEPSAFGVRPEDLDIDFEVADRTSTAVAVVAQLTTALHDESAGEPWAWSLPISSRTLQLLRIVEASQGSPMLTLISSCPAPDCRDELELELPLSELILQGAEALGRGPELNWEAAPSRALTVRRATGRDQRAWRQQRFARQRDANLALLSSLAVRGSEHLGDLDARQQEELSEALHWFDPLAAFRVAVQCPSCGRHASLPVDLEAACLVRLKSLKVELLQAVHRLAKSHGWSERDVLGLSPGRRAAYLALIDREESAP
jgi:hypothetical protein